MLLFWGSLLCWGLLSQAQGEAQHTLFLRISKNELERDISDLFSEHHILDRMARIPVTGTRSKGVPILDHLPFVKKGLSKKSSGLDLSLVGDLLSGKSLPLLAQLLRAGGLVIEDAKGPEVTLQVLSDSLLQVTLRSKLYLSLQRILRLQVIKNIRIGVRLAQAGNRNKLAFEECHTPPGFLSTKALERTDPLLVNEALTMVTGVLDEALPFLLQKIVCPVARALLSLLLEGLLHIILPPTISGPGDFQYYVTTTEFTEEAILMKVQLVTPCGPGQRAPRFDLLAPQPVPNLAQGSMADLAFWLEAYNDILSCLYTSKDICVDPQDSTATDLIQLLSLRELEPRPKASTQPRRRMGLTISTPAPPTVRLDRHTATVIQPGSGVLLRPKTPFKGCVFLKKSEIKTPVHSKQEGLKALVSELLKRAFLPHHNKLLGEQHLPLPGIKGICFNQARMEPSEDYLLLTTPEDEVLAKGTPPATTAPEP